MLDLTLTDIFLGLFIIALVIFETALVKDVFGKKYLCPGSPEFKEALEREAKKLGLEEKEISVIYFPGKQGSEHPASSIKTGDGTYSVCFWQGNLYTHATIRHELYHIYAGHCDRGYELFRRANATRSGFMRWIYVTQDRFEYFAFQEIRAQLYGLFKIG
ncbi:MAG: hypothetical protein Q7S28_01050 [bacterium]|nr:hypothetical protein [bacterium]